MTLRPNMLASAAAFVLGFASLASAEDLTVVSFGGAYGAAQQEHMIGPFAEATGTNVLFEDYSGGIAEIKAQVEADNVQWDVVDIEVIDLERACSEGLLEIIPRDILPAGDDGTPAMDDFIPSALANECGVGVIVWTIVYAFNSETMTGDTPSTIADLFDTERFPGMRAFRKRPQVNMEWALIADGVAPEDVYEVLATEEGQARAFTKLETIRDDIVWFDSWSQAPQLLNDGGAVMVQSANGRIFSAIQEDGKPFEMVWDNHVFDLDVWAIVRGSAQKELAMDFIASATQSRPLAGMADVAYGPTRLSSAAYVDAAVVPDLPTSHIDQGLKADGIFWADFGESLGEQFNEWLLQ
ncbi:MULTISPECIES: ABC transporter substrate-binding protein [Rhodobacterales]|uniref:ABC transporter substrate-binding protein n=1 Tax=Ascidiaceihabitans sp. TaxID=1872644 RepID=UPI0032974531